MTPLFPTLALAAVLVSLSPTARAAVDTQSAHAQGACGQLRPGTGLSGNKGWVVSMLPGRHEFRMRGGGAVFVTASRQQAFDFDAGRPYYLVIEGARPNAVLEWKTPASDWAPIATPFLYPVQR